MANKLLQLLVQTGDVSDKFLPNLLPKAQKGIIVPPPNLNKYDNIPNPATVRRDIMMREQVAQQAARQALRDKQGYIRNAEPDESGPSRVWNIMTNPMTALSYKTRGKDIPAHFERGPQNILEMATNVVNPFYYMNEGKEAGRDIGSFAKQVVTDPYHANPNKLGSGLLHGLSALPLLSELGPELRGAQALSNEQRVLREIVDPETGESSFIAKPKPVVEPEVTYGTDDMGSFRRVGNRKEYILNERWTNPPIVNRDQFNELSNLYGKPDNVVPTEIENEFGRRHNLNMNDLASDRHLINSINSQRPYEDYLARSRFADQDRYTMQFNHDPNFWNNVVQNDNGFQRLRNGFSQLGNPIKSSLSKLDRKLGTLLPSRTPVDINHEELEAAINQNLRNGMGIKKIGEPVSVKLNMASDEPNRLFFDTYVDNGQTGRISFLRNTAPYDNRMQSFTDRIFPSNNPMSKWVNTEGFKKTGDYPFNNSTRASEYYNKGVSGEINAAINAALKEKNLGNILSGGTGHTPMGADRWKNLVNKGFAEDFGYDPITSQNYYKLKKDGGPIVDPRGQWAHPGKVTRIPSSNITMKGVPYPVYGVGSNGQEQMMYPENHYDFGGASYVDEYPMMQNGGNTLPEITVYGHRNPTAKTYFDRWRKEAESWQDREEPINTPMSKYLAAEQMFDKYKGKNINMIEKGTRPTFSPFSNTLNIVNPEDDYYGNSFINELPHQLQKDKIGAWKFATRHLTKDLWGTLKNISLSDTLNPDAWTRAYENNYFTPGTQEYEAHSIIEPKLKDEFKILADKEYNKLTANKNKMQKGGLTKKQPKAPVVNPYMDVDSQAADAFRSMIPLPGNASQMLAKVAFKDARMSNSSLTDEQKLILWNTIQNARKRSGVVNGGGTEYQDYGNQGYGTSDDFNDWFNRGKVGFIKGAYRSMTNPGFNLASTIGRGRYWQDPNNPDDVMYTDVYDWNPTESNFKGTNAYQLLRNQLRSGEDKNLNQQKNDNYRMNFKLSKKEIDEIQRRKDMAAQGTLGLGLFKYGGQNKQPLERKHNIKVTYK
jgi:hypothetical protein